MSQASETQLPMLNSSESWGGLHHPDVWKNSPGRFGLRSWQSEFFCDLLDGGEQIGGKYSLSSEFLVPRLSSWEHFGSWNRIAGTDAQLPVAFLGGTWWNNSWDSARKAYWCSFRSPQTCLELSRTTKNYMVAPLISEGTHQFKIAFMDAPSPPTASFLASKLDRFGGKSGYPTVDKKMAHQDFLICPQDTQNQDVFSLLVNEISVAIYIDVSCRSMRWISLNW